MIEFRDVKMVNLDKIQIELIIDIIRRLRSSKAVSSYYIYVCILCPCIVGVRMSHGQTVHMMYYVGL